MEIKEKPVCQYGSKCYRKNPNHLQKYSHPDTNEKSENSSDTHQPPTKKQKLEKNVKGKGNDKLKQTTLQFAKTKPSEKQQIPNKTVKAESFRSLRNNKSKKTNRKVTKTPSPKKKVVESEDSEKEGENINESSDDDSKNESGTVQSTSWVFINKPSTETTESSSIPDLKGKTPEEIIKTLFLVDMPSDFYSFYEFCKLINKENPRNALDLCKLKLVGPFDVLIGDKEFAVDKESILCHWRYYFDPPEFQTVLATDSTYHMGYWRDDPSQLPDFVASNVAEKDCIIKIEADNVFGGVFQYMEDFIKRCDPFKKTKVQKLLGELSNWANKNKFSLERVTSRMNTRQKKSVSKTFHKAGIVVPVEAKTELGYRPLIETDANLKKMCKLIMNASDENERESLLENLQPLINAANIANDECDFGNSLELGIDLFCMGSPTFHEIVEHLLTTAYSLLDRQPFEEIIKAHLKNRRKGKDLSVC